MKELPIIFSGPMVKSILHGKKTQTRRIVSPQPTYLPHLAMWGWKQVAGGGSEISWAQDMADPIMEYCPYGQPGDHLWVRESWAMRTAVYSDGIERTSICYAATPKYGIRVPGCLRNVDQMCYLHVSTPLEHHGWGWPIKWRPSIHLPRKYSRITLEITSVRVERLQYISDDDIVAEGIDYMVEKDGSLSTTFNRQAFATVWDKINGKRNGCAWTNNPWVWVVEFEPLSGK
jgi:hypothetical protein